MAEDTSALVRLGWEWAGFFCFIPRLRSEKLFVWVTSRSPVMRPVDLEAVVYSRLAAWVIGAVLGCVYASDF